MAKQDHEDKSIWYVLHESKDMFHMENDETPETQWVYGKDGWARSETKPSPTLEKEAYHAPWYERFAIQPLEFCVKNGLGIREHAIIKYICRYPYKGQPVKDLYQARFYIDELIKELEEKEKGYEKHNV